jgi:DNA-binding CsgD family transcriptional regulator
MRARRGEDGVWECLDEAAEAAEGTGEPQWVVPVRLARAEAYWLEGGSAAAERELTLAHDISAGSGAWLRGEIAVWLRRTSGPPESWDALDGRIHRQLVLAEPYRLQLTGAWDAAAQAWLALGCLYDAALALLDANQDEPLRQALGIFSHLGASAAARIARQRMRRLGLRSIPNGAQTATRAHPLGLTRREREVLELMCSGHTNAEIAARLVISTKTVDHHVSAVLAKLGAPTRIVAAAEAIRLGLVSAAKA